MFKPGSLRKLLFADESAELRGVRGLALKLGRLVYLAVREFRSDLCYERAMGLTFATIISLFPLSVLFATIAMSFGGGQEIIDYVKDRVFEYVAPEFQDSLSKWLDDSFSEGAIKQWPTEFINLVAGFVLLLSALGVLVMAERAFNRIWKSPSRRTYIQKVTAFWVILTTSPIMIVASMGVGKLLAPEGDAGESLAEPSGFLYDVAVPACVGFLGFTMIFLFLPSTRVRLRSAAVGALVAMVFWEIAKRSFYLYVESRGGDTNFYSQVAAVPLFLIWLYLSWVITLWGGEICYVYQNLSKLSRGVRLERHQTRHSRVYLGTLLTARIAEAFNAGRSTLSIAELTAELEVEAHEFDEVARTLAAAGVILEDAASPGCYTLAQNPRRVGIDALVRVLEEKEFPADQAAERGRESEKSASPALRRRLDELLGRARAASRKVLAEGTLEDLVGPGDVASRDLALPPEDERRPRKAVDSRP